MGTMASQITSLKIFTQPFIQAQWPVNSQHKGPITRKMYPFDDVIIFSKDKHMWCIIWNLHSWSINPGWPAVLDQCCKKQIGRTLECLPIIAKRSLSHSDVPMTLAGGSAIVGGLQSTWWHHDMETISTLLAVCDCNLLATGGSLKKIR